MGKVLDSFLHLFPGAVSRTADEIVISLKNAGNGAIYPGTAVFLAADGGVTAVRPGSTFDEFVGIAVRIPSHTPETYGANVAPYGVNDPVDILVRGCVAVAIENANTVVGGEVHLNLSDGTYAVEEEEDVTIQLENCSWRRSGSSADHCAEIVIRERNLV